MRVVVTGGAGFIGSAVCRHFIADLKHDVVVVDKLTYAGNMASLAPVASSSRYAFEKHDICDSEAIEGIFAKYQPDAVVHLAAGKSRRSLDFRLRCLRENKCSRHLHAS